MVEGGEGVMVDVCGEMKMTPHTLHSGLSDNCASCT